MRKLIKMEERDTGDERGVVLELTWRSIEYASDHFTTLGGLAVSIDALPRSVDRIETVTYKGKADRIQTLRVYGNLLEDSIV